MGLRTYIIQLDSPITENVVTNEVTENTENTTENTDIFCPERDFQVHLSKKIIINWLVFTCEYCN